MKLKRGTPVRTTMGNGIILDCGIDLKFDRIYYMVDVAKSELLARRTGSKYEAKKFWDYEVKGVKS